MELLTNEDITTIKEITQNNEFLRLEIIRLINKLTNNKADHKTYYIIKNMIYGLYNEYKFLKLVNIEDLKNAPLVRCNYDFYSLNMFYELKTNTYGYNRHKYAVVNTNKTRYNNLVFIFGYNEGDYIDFYYIQYNKDIFNKYNVRTIETCNFKNEVYDIVKTDLLQITHKGEVLEDFKKNGFILHYNLNNGGLKYNDVKEQEIALIYTERQELEKVKNYIFYEGICNQLELI